MNCRTPIVVVAVVAVAALLIFMVNAYEKQLQEERVMKLQIETVKEMNSGEIVKETENIVIYDKDDIEKIEEQLRALGYIE